MKFNCSFSKLRKLLWKNMYLILAFVYGFLYCFILTQILGPRFHRVELLPTSEENKNIVNLTATTKTETEENETAVIENILPFVDPFNPFVVQAFVRSLGELSCRGKVYGQLKRGRLYLPAGMFQEISYTAVGEKTNNKVYIVGERPARNRISSGFQGYLQHISGKCVHPSKAGPIKAGVGLIFFEGCQGSERVIYVLEKDGKWRDASRNFCVEPKGGLHYPPNRTPLVFATSCGVASKFRSLSNGAIQHVSSGLCVHPEFGLVSTEDDEKLVLYDGCHQRKLKFVWRNARSAVNVFIPASHRKISKEIIKLAILLPSQTLLNVLTEHHLQVIEKPDVVTRPRITVPEGEQFDVLLVMFHSMSFANFQRTMPRVFEFLKEDPETVTLPGFSLLGEGEFSQTEAILAGLRPNDKQDTSSWLFKSFHDAGYATMVTQDHVESEFKVMVDKFGASFIDHFPEALWEKIKRNTAVASLCLGPQFTFNMSLSYLTSFLSSYINRPKFSFMINSAISSWNMNTARYAEKPLLQFLKKKNRKRLKKTVIVIYGNHGWKGNGLRETTQGKLEERLPFLSITTPSQFRKKYPEKFKNMVFNSKFLTSPLDVHATLNDLLSLSKAGGNLTRDTDKTQGQSLFTEFDPKSRNCSYLGIPEHWCPMVSLSAVKVSKYNLKRISKVIMENLNVILKKAPVGMCEELHFGEIVSFKMFKFSDKVLRYRTSESTNNCSFCKPVFNKARARTKDFIYQVDISVEPDGNVYRTMMNLVQNDLYIGVKPRLIVGQPGSCMLNEDSFIANYCTCKESDLTYPTLQGTLEELNGSKWTSGLNH